MPLLSSRSSIHSLIEMHLLKSPSGSLRTPIYSRLLLFTSRKHLPTMALSVWPRRMMPLLCCCGWRQLSSWVWANWVAIWHCNGPNNGCKSSGAFLARVVTYSACSSLWSIMSSATLGVYILLKRALYSLMMAEQFDSANQHIRLPALWNEWSNVDSIWDRKSVV